MGEEMKVADLLSIFSGPDRTRIIKDNTVIHTGYLTMFPEEFKGEVVKRFKVVSEIRHKQWKERRLMPPMEPAIMANYKFSDLEMKIYYDIYI